MKKITLILLLFGLTISWSQEQEALVFFKDKKEIMASMENPALILTNRAIERKQKHNVLIDASDVPVDPSYITQLKNLPDIAVLAKSKWLNTAYVRGDQTAIEALLDQQYVEAIEFMDKDLKASRPVERDKAAGKWGITLKNRSKFDYGTATNQTEMIAADRLHAQDYTGRGMIIAVLDSGFPGVFDNPAFQHGGSFGRFTPGGRHDKIAKIQDLLLGTYDFIDREKDVENEIDDHGALTFSDMAGYLDGDLVGTAPDASYYLFRTEDGATETPAEEAYWVEALERADSLGVDVVNTSLGYRDFFDNPDYNYTYEDLDGKTTLAARGANIAFEKGLLIVVSAGNEGDGEFKKVGTPADSPNVLTVGAVDLDSKYIGFSSLGPTVDGRIKPDVVAQGSPTAVVDPEGDIAFVYGTSFSSPITAGAVACLWQALPDLDNGQIMQLVRESASTYETPSDSLGYGIPNFEKALAKGRLLNLRKKQDPHQFEVAANPVRNDISLIFPKNSGAVRCMLYDILGTKIKAKTLKPSDNKMDVSELSRGIYIFTVKTRTGDKSFKIVKR